MVRKSNVDIKELQEKAVHYLCDRPNNFPRENYAEHNHSDS